MMPHSSQGKDVWAHEDTHDHWLSSARTPYVLCVLPHKAIKPGEFAGAPGVHVEGISGGHGHHNERLVQAVQASCCQQHCPPHGVHRQGRQNLALGGHGSLQKHKLQGLRLGLEVQVAGITFRPREELRGYAAGRWMLQ